MPDGVTRRLFPLEWSAERDGHLFGGCGAYVDDEAAPSIVHTGTVHDGAGPLPGNAYVVRRSYPTGEAQWVFTADHQPTGLDIDGNLVYVAFNSGELVILSAAHGAVVARYGLQVGGHGIIPLSLVHLDSGRLAIGTMDGRVLVCSIGAKRD